LNKDSKKSLLIKAKSKWSKLKGQQNLIVFNHLNQFFLI